MAKIVDRPLNPGKTNISGEKTIVRDSQTGKSITINTVDANSKTVANDLSEAFRSNVGAALRKRK